MKKKLIVIIPVVVVVLFALISSTSSALLSGNISKNKSRLPKNLNIVVCLMHWNSTDPVISMDYLQTEMQKVRAWFREISYDTLNISSEFVGNHTWNSALPGTPAEETHAAISSCDPDVDFSTVDAVIITPSVSLREGEGANGGPEYDVMTDEGKFDLSIVRIGLVTNFSANVVQHELGHALFNLQHENALECEDKTFDANFRAFSSPTCQIIDYGNPFSLMSEVSNGHLSGWFKHLAGSWGNLNQIKKDGQYLLQALELSDAGKSTFSKNKNVNVLRIPFETYSICVDYRKPLLTDQGFSTETYANEGLPGGIPSNGCLFPYLCPASPGPRTTQKTSLLLDTTPNSQRDPRGDWIDFLDACIPQDTVYSDRELGIDELSFTNHPKFQNKAFVKLKIDDSRLAKTPELYGGVLAASGPERCSFADLKLEIVNSTELPVTKPFIISLYGRNPDGSETRFLEKKINYLEAGEIMIVRHINASSFQEIRTVIDENNSIREVDETNNESRLAKSCV